VNDEARWKIRVIERSVARAAGPGGSRRVYESVAARALRPTTRIVQSASELARESTGAPFTVREILGRAHVSLQTFYRHFGSKDDVLLAVIEESVTRSAERFRARAFRLDDAVARVEYVVKAPFASQPQGMSATITREHLRLLEGRAREIEAADDAYRMLLADTIRSAQDNGRFLGLEADEEADTIMTLVLARYHGLVLGVARRALADEAAEIWAFCQAALSRGEAGRTT
jgi:AcrR family transcriptional regulator